MKRNSFRIKPLTETSLLDNYTMSIGAIGFETRARFAFSKLPFSSGKKVAVQFKDRQVHDFKVNKKYFMDKGYISIEPSPAGIRKEIRELTLKYKESFPKEKITCIVDISSITRAHLAGICYEWYAASQKNESDVTIDFVYSHAEYSEPPAEFGPIKVRGPVISELCGWSAEPDIPVSLVIGVGYEKDIALGITEELEPSDLIVFRPIRHDEKYSQAIDKLNLDFIQTIPINRIIEYNVYDMYTLYITLCNAVAGLSHDTRPTLVPLGPKIFSLGCILSGLEWMPYVSVWRVSAAEYGDPVNRSPNGNIGYLRLEMGNAE